MNTLFVVTQDAMVRRDHLTLKVVVEKQTKLTVPIHQIDGLAVFGHVYVTPSAMALCAENNVAVSFMTESGRLQARVEAPNSGNVLLRREQFRAADDETKRTAISQAVVAGKVHNARNLLLRSARESTVAEDQQPLTAAVNRLADSLPLIGAAKSADSVRGYEGDAARVYFEVFTHLIRQNRDSFTPQGRTRRPPLDRMNAVLSFLYGLLRHDCAAALQAVGLDPSVGFLHVDRPGRPGLALDLMEEFRPLVADRVALALVNRRQILPEGFIIRDGGGVEINDTTRRTIISEYQKRKREEVMHPTLDQKCTIGRLWFLQARILARVLRGDLPVYVPCILKN
ncbi:MAG: type I-C CRISPR-associated endonuclease Cas1c [Fimbriiglobus sp.]